MPVVASMGGIAGTQTLTLAIRGIALGQLSANNIRWLLAKEMAVSVINSAIWAVMVAAVALLWFGSVDIALIIGVAITINLLAATFSGALLPLLLQRLDIDPALAGGVILTTVTDVVGFLAFSGARDPVLGLTKDASARQAQGARLSSPCGVGGQGLRAAVWSHRAISAQGTRPLALGSRRAHLD